MKRVNNRMVAACWLNGSEAVSHTGNYRTDGSKLWSYNLQIGDTAGELKILKDYTAKGINGFKSQTTSCHVGLARISADIVV